MKGLFISGSGTDVGKTFIASHLIQALNEKYKVVARKPIESDCGSDLHPKDATLLNDTCINPEQIDIVCPFKFEACVSGEKASADLGVSFDLQDLVQAVQPAHSGDFVIIEGAGGFYSPMAKQVLNSDLATALGLPLVIVVKDELGAVNQALLTIEAVKKCGLTIAILILNQIAANELDNAQALGAYTDVEVVVFNKDTLGNFNAKIMALI